MQRPRPDFDSDDESAGVAKKHCLDSAWPSFLLSGYSIAGECLVSSPGRKLILSDLDEKRALSPEPFLQCELTLADIPENVVFRTPSPMHKDDGYRVDEEESSTQSSDFLKQLRGSALYRTFNAGDLLYGLDMTIGRSSLSSRKTWKELVEKKHPGVTVIIDEMNNQFIKESQVDESNGYHDLSKREIRQLSVTTHSFRSFLFSHERYNPQRSGGKDLMGVLPHEDHERNAKIRRACKAGILWAITQDSTVHVLTANINFSQVMTKVNMQHSFLGARRQQKIDCSITGSELRYIYRLMHGLSDPGNEEKARARIKFYDQLGNLVDPPWMHERDKALWDEYAKQIRDKKRVCP